MVDEAKREREMLFSKFKIAMYTATNGTGIHLNLITRTGIVHAKLAKSVDVNVLLAGTVEDIATASRHYGEVLPGLPIHERLMAELREREKEKPYQAERLLHMLRPGWVCSVPENCVKPTGTYPLHVLNEITDINYNESHLGRAVRRVLEDEWILIRTSIVELGTRLCCAASDVWDAMQETGEFQPVGILQELSQRRE
jgi:hypothetical protein